MSAASGPTIRLANPADAAAIARVHTRSRAAYYGAALPWAGPDLDREPMWARYLADADRFSIVATAHGDVIAFLSACREERGGWDLTALYVIPESFGRGVGRRLHDEFVRHIHGAAAVLEVWDGNTRAKGFYTSHGWAPTLQRRPGPAGSPFVRWELAADVGAHPYG